jgi:gas vesicle protein
MTSPTEAREHEDRGWIVTCAFLCGAATGAAVALLFTTESGRDTRERFLTKVREGRDYLSRQEYIETLESQLQAWSTTIDAMAAKVGHASADARIEYEKQIEDLRRRWEGARHTLDDLRVTGGAAWQDLASGAERAWQELRRAMEVATSRLS